MTILIQWAVLSLGVWVASAILPGFKIKKFVDAIVVAMVFGLLNWAIGWLIFVVIGVATLGLGFLLSFLTRLFVLALLLKLTDALTERVEIKSFGWALGASAVIALFNGIADAALQTLL